MMDQKDDQIDRVIDHAAREMTMGHPSAPFEASVMARVERARSAAVVSSFRLTVFSRGVQVAVAGAVAMLLLFVAVARRPAQPPNAAAVPRTTQQNIPLVENGIDTRTPSTQSRIRPAQRLRTAGVTAALPPIEPLVLESIDVERIEDAPALALAAIEFTGLRLDPVGTVNMQENQ